MDTHKYKCNYCHEEYIPKRRYVQKYCSDSCRSKAYHRRIKNNNKLKPTEEEKNNNIGKVDKMSLAGVGNATTGALIAEGIINLFTSEGNKPATKSDIVKLLNTMNRYHKINNIRLNMNNQQPYFDMTLGTVVYF